MPPLSTEIVKLRPLTAEEEKEAKRYRELNDKVCATVQRTLPSQINRFLSRQLKSKPAIYHAPGDPPQRETKAWLERSTGSTPQNIDLYTQAFNGAEEVMVPEAKPRRIASFDDTQVYYGGSFMNLLGVYPADQRYEVLGDILETVELIEAANNPQV